MLSQEPDTPDVQMRPLLAPGAWQGIGYGRCGPIEKQHLGHSVSPSGGHPTLRPGLIKGGSQSCSLSSSPPSSHLISSRLCVGCSSLPLLFAASSLTDGVRLRHAYSGGPVWSARCHELRQSDEAGDNALTLEVGMLKRSVPQRYTLH